MHSYRKEGNDGGNFGHEAAGTVEELGEGVKTLVCGQRVGVSAIAGCGNCEECRQGRYTWCANWWFFQHMHAEFFVIPALSCHVLPDNVPWDIGVKVSQARSFLNTSNRVVKRQSGRLSRKSFAGSLLQQPEITDSSEMITWELPLRSSNRCELLQRCQGYR